MERTKPRNKVAVSGRQVELKDARVDFTPPVTGLTAVKRVQGSRDVLTHLTKGRVKGS